VQKYRVLSFVIIHFLILLHIFGFGQEFIGSLDFQELFHSFLKVGTINSGVIMVFIVFFTTLIFGRFFCGWACHFGAVQELSWFILQKLNITPKTVNSRLVVLFPLFILLHFYIIPNLDYALNNDWEITIVTNTPDIWAFLPGFIIGLLTFFVDGFLIVYFLGRKGFCRFLCPWGAFLKLPSALAVYKIRNVGNCSNCGACTKNCPIGIDVNYEINTFNKVVNTNCTNCMICTDGCPTSTIKFSYTNPLNEKYQLTDFFIGNKTHKDSTIKGFFINLRLNDLWLGLLSLLIGFSIDGLFGMGHFLSFGIALLISYNLLNEYNNKLLRTFITSITFIIICWAISVKYSINEGVVSYENKNYYTTIKYLKYSTRVYPNKIGKYFIYLADSYFEIGDLENAKKYTKIAFNINPNHQSVKQMQDKIANN
jgi:polyferredoxin